MKLEYSKILKWFRYNCKEQMDRLFDSLSPNQIEIIIKLIQQ